eukprot:XP_011670461.1 PREDICTED: uncharacterized protein LOC105441235 [Strongylocentrotus purpuratus]
MQILFFLGGWIFFMRKLFKNYEVHHGSVQLTFSVTFALSCTLFELIIFEILGVLHSDSRFFHWRIDLYAILFVLIVVLPFYIAYFLVSNVPFVVKRRMTVFLTAGAWLVFIYFFWKLGDPFPILSPKHGECLLMTIFCDASTINGYVTFLGKASEVSMDTMMTGSLRPWLIRETEASCSSTSAAFSSAHISLKSSVHGFNTNHRGREYARFMLENLFDVASGARRHQTCKEMCKQLVPKTIKDPFASLPPEQRIEELQLGAVKQEGVITEPHTELNKDLKLFPDVWKDQAKCKEKELLLPELVSSAYTNQCPHPNVCEVMPDHCLRLEQDSYTDPFNWSEREFLESVSSHAIGLHQEQLPRIGQVDGDPVKLNHEGLGPLDHKEKFGDLEQGSLEPPRTPIDVSKSAKDPGLDHVKVPMTPISCFDAEIVTPKTKEKTENRMWKTEQCLHEAVALSLKVPEIKNNEKPDPVPSSPKSQLGLTKEHGNSDVDLLVR